MADAPAPADDKPKDGSAPDDGADDDGKPAKDQPSAPAATVAGHSISSVVVADRLTIAAIAIAQQVTNKAGGRTIAIVEDRLIAESALPLTEVQAALASCSGLLATLDAALLAAPRPPSPPAPPAGGIQPTVAGEGGGGEGGEGGGTEGQGAETQALDVIESAKGVADILKLFASTIEVAPQDIAADRTALSASVAGRIAGVRVVWPSSAGMLTTAVFMTAGTVTAGLWRTTLAVNALESAWSPVTGDIARRQDHLAALTATRDECVKAGDMAGAANLAPEITAAEARIAAASTPDLAAAKATITTARVAIDAIRTRVDAISTPGPTGRSQLQAAAIRQHLETVVGTGDWAALWVDATAIGGDRVKRSSPLGWSSELSYLGAAQATFLLVAKDGELLASDALSTFGFRVFDFASFSGGIGAKDPSRPPRLLNVELLEVLAVLVGLVIILLMIQAIFD